MKRRNVLLAALLTMLCLLCGLTACKSGTGSARVLDSDEKTLVLYVDEAKGNVTLLSLMEDLKEAEQLDFKMSGTMVTAINGVENTADFSGCWMLYTTDVEMANNAWGTISYNGKTLGSAIVGADSLLVTAGELYVWSYQSF